MTFVPCSVCGGMLGEDETCLNGTCLNSARGRELAASHQQVPVDVAAALSTTPGAANLGPNRAERRKAKRSRRQRTGKRPHGRNR